MKNKKLIGSFELSNSDIEAITCALPLVVELGADSPQQEEINATLCASAGQKLIAQAYSLSANEIRVVSAAVTAAVLFLSGKCTDFFSKISSERKEELSKHFFVLNRLDPIFQGFVEHLHN